MLRLGQRGRGVFRAAFEHERRHRVPEEMTRSPLPHSRAQDVVAAIDQVLSYLSWRDTKVALIVFNRRKDISGVLAAIPDAAAPA